MDGMCGRYSLTKSPAEIADFFHLTDAPEFEPRYNIAPTQQVAAIRAEEDGDRRRLLFLRWGLIPFWAKDIKVGYKMINARAESVDRSPSFRTSFRLHRCLVVADGFYDWKKEGKEKKPYYVRLRGGEPFAFAGLWARWEDPEAPEEIVESCTIITTDANDLLRPIHDRMPVLLEAGDYDLWLDPEVDDPKELLPLLRPAASEGLSLRPVSAYVNKATNEGAECIAPAAEDLFASLRQKT